MKNYMEVLVDQHLPFVISKYSHIKDCEVCKNDIRATALNNLKPYYVNSDRGLIFTKLKDLDYQFNSDIIRELVQAAEKVSNSPRCH